MKHKTIGEWIRWTRKNCCTYGGRTQGEIAGATSISVSLICRYEANKTPPTALWLIDFSRCTSVAPQELIAALHSTDNISIAYQCERIIRYIERSLLTKIGTGELIPPADDGVCMCDKTLNEVGRTFAQRAIKQLSSITRG